MAGRSISNRLSVRARGSPCACQSLLPAKPSCTGRIPTRFGSLCLPHEPSEQKRGGPQAEYGGLDWEGGATSTRKRTVQLRQVHEPLGLKSLGRGRRDSAVLTVEQFAEPGVHTRRQVKACEIVRDIQFNLYI